MNTIRTSVWRTSALRSAFRPSAYSGLNVTSRRTVSTEHLPSIVQPSLWKSLVPKLMRNRKTVRKKGESAAWKSWKNNPASFFIVMFILIGSMSINLLSMKNDFNKFNRHMDAKLEILKEVIGRLQKGEKFDVDRALGAGDETSESEWDQVINDLTRKSSVQEKSKVLEAKPKVTEAAEITLKPQVSSTNPRKVGMSSFF